ncbi:MAG: UDP-N-acetylmuramoyl-L-alanyl-D-glutamate--2,6-diaminopimelate ligase [Betaproteobacteria bacterium]|nr:UDP-N-acetylmuramoyl-L-alanyl-D-glutamate--2,6-diaminopimelate ligase [Betaproteobacteria bacterium]
MSAALLPDVPAAAAWLRARLAPGAQLCTDSRVLRAGDAFLAYPGHAHDGRQHVASAYAQGAAACIVEAEGAAAFNLDARTGALQGLKQHAGELAALHYGQPGEQLAMVAVTGTNGKTSTSYWVAQALAALGCPCGLVGTLGVGRPGQLHGTGLTTPDPVVLQHTLREFVDTGLRACAMEASSIGLAEGRMQGMPVTVAVFTNLTQDHLDYHGDMQAYAAAKRRLFEWPGLQAGVLNLDDAFGRELDALLRRRGVRSLGYGAGAGAQLRASAPRHAAEGMVFDIVMGTQRATVQVPVVGRYNVDNLLAVCGSLLALGHPFDAAVAALQAVTPVPGRLQRVARDGAPLAVVDYAHTPDALEKALQALRPVAQARGGRLWCVFGCGGDRDPGKRPLMGAAAQRGSDLLVLTSDNPRSEQPQAILDDILRGLQAAPTYVDTDRAAAVAWAIAHAAPADVVLIAGKGHEAYQIIGATAVPFSDVQQAEAALQRYGTHARQEHAA